MVSPWPSWCHPSRWRWLLPMCRLWSSGWCFPFLFPFSHLDGWSMMILYSYYIKFEINDKPLSWARSSAFSAPISSYNIDNIAWISMWSLKNFILTLLPCLFHWQVEQPHTWGMWVATQVSQSHSSARWFFWSDVGRSWTFAGTMMWRGPWSLPSPIAWATQLWRRCTSLHSIWLRRGFSFRADSGNKRNS